MDNVKTCIFCGIQKPVDEFGNQYYKNKNGVKTTHRKGLCKKCEVKRCLKWKKDNPAASNRSNLKWRKNNYENNWAIATLCQHRTRGNTTNISSKELCEIARNTKHCYICGKLLDWSSGKKVTKENSASLDRINNDNFISKENISIVCHSCNRTKSNRTMDEFLFYCKVVLERFGYAVQLGDKAFA